MLAENLTSPTTTRVRPSSHSRFSNDMDRELSAAGCHTEGSRIVLSHAKPISIEDRSLCDDHRPPCLSSISEVPSVSSGIDQRPLGETSFCKTLSQLQEIKQRLLASVSRHFQYRSMPSRLTASQLVDAYIQGVPAFLLTWNLSQAEALLDTMYNENRTPSCMDLAEFFVLITGGADYDTEGLLSEDEKAVYCASSISYLLECTDIDCLRTMRMLLSLVLILLSQHCQAIGHILRTSV